MFCDILKLALPCDPAELKHAGVELSILASGLACSSKFSHTAVTVLKGPRNSDKQQEEIAA